MMLTYRYRLKDASARRHRPAADLFVSGRRRRARGHDIQATRPTDPRCARQVCARCRAQLEAKEKLDERREQVKWLIRSGEL
jgi:hypothetical protein